MIKKTSRIYTDEMNCAVRSKPRLNTWLTDSVKFGPSCLWWDWRSSWLYECGRLHEPETKNANHRNLKLKYLYSEAIFKDRLAKAHCSLDISSYCIQPAVFTSSDMNTQQHEQSGQDLSFNKFGRWCWPLVRTALTGRTEKRPTSFCTKTSGKLPSYL